MLSLISSSLTTYQLWVISSFNLSTTWAKYVYTSMANNASYSCRWSPFSILEMISDKSILSFPNKSEVFSRVLTFPQGFWFFLEFQVVIVLFWIQLPPPSQLLIWLTLSDLELNTRHNDSILDRLLLQLQLMSKSNYHNKFLTLYHS